MNLEAKMYEHCDSSTLCTFVPFERGLMRYSILTHIYGI